ncbi:MAG: homoserine dehydrogenase [Nitratireductor sp.]|nr:homoserine dehydrogenase [Nitratireductor sp.]MCC0019697.1 homoserine dehydrogenase [Nitratireductor sp.]
MENPLKIGIAGVGTVGASLVNVLNNKQNALANRCGRRIDVAAFSARSRDKDRGCDLTGAEFFDDPVKLAQSGIDVFVELIGGEDGAALESVRAALKSGKHVVTANKALLARHGVELAALAEENGLILNFEAAVAGGIPIIKTMREALSANDITRVYGILNGTCNYMLTRMENEGISFEDCLADAQRLGYAEADPTFDIGGFDTAHKLAILTSIAFGSQIAADEIYVEGISNITNADIEAAHELGYRIKLLGVCQKTASGIEQRVHPTMVPLESEIAQIGGVTNAVALEADIVGELVLSGPGAGGMATASAVAGDICDIAKSRPGRQIAPALGRPAAELEPYRKARMRTHEGGYFIRFTVRDKTGVFASIATRMAEHDISLDSIVQHAPARPVEDGEAKTIILITDETTESAVRAAIEAIEGDGHLIARPQMIRIEL